MAALSFRFEALRKGFFDAQKVAAAAEKAEAKVQSRFGAYVRRRMQTSIKYKKGTAPEGSPPYAHRSERFTRPKTVKKTGATARQPSSPLRDLIFFARDPSTGSVVIGPVPFGARGAAALERGGSETVTDRRTGTSRRVTIRPHPFARPAGEAEAAKLPEMLKKMCN